ncbi:hypothetical protein PsYK624_126590 [Phanerochaete sordida]|uniref:Uncharacterized protein n=1 Tax=Phanerochaete sordida TaxID=48140 RepID=A0A9P3LJQ8_9APHY|nr:hypothetical protein PsYK624_126590 [Phanerochaete sordida]
MPFTWTNIHMSRPTPLAAVDLMDINNVTARTVARPPRSSSLRNIQQAQAVRPSMKLIPLSVAAARDDVRRRAEGFEMQHKRLHLALMRCDIRA